MTALQLPAFFTADQLSNEEYHASEGISCSGIKLLNERPPAVFHAKYIGPRRAFTQRQPMIIGTAIHAAALEPKKFEQEYTIVPAQFKDKRAAGYKAWSETEQRIILTRDEYRDVLGMRKALHEHPLAGWLLDDDPQFEYSFFAKEPETGVTVRARADFVTKSRWIFDLKKCQDASEGAIQKVIYRLGYYMQDSYYRQVYQLAHGEPPAGFGFIFVEEEYPHLINVVSLEPEDIQRGAEMVRRGIGIYKDCLDSNKWPGYPSEAKYIPLRRWDRQEIDSTIGLGDF